VTRLLVSVRSAQEALAALAGGADLIDVKEPQLGSLGAAMPHVRTEIAAAIGDACPLSAALGELRDFAPVDPESLRGYAFAKLGLANVGDDWQVRWQAALHTLPPWITPVGVAYADTGPSPDAVCEVGHRLGCKALLVDTFDKTRGCVFDYLSSSALDDVFRAAHGQGLMSVLAGSLRLEHVALALALQADYIGVRGAVCGKSRESELEQALVEQWAEALISER